MLPIETDAAAPADRGEPALGAPLDGRPGSSGQGVTPAPLAVDEGIVWEEERVDTPGASASADSPEEEEATVPRMPREPTQPTEAERRLHEPTHLPFRSWCPHCVSGRLDKLPHASEVGGDHAAPEFLMDHCSICTSNSPHR